ncbi:MAG: helix-turn-helix transcriptional regulator [Planctomycetaceae bacterium]|nr:helix-turn-helix domain-containing protein [Planctomycetaceae bacterium]
MAIDDDIRKALAASGRSRYAIAKESGILESQLSRFLHGERGLNVANLQRLARVLGLEIIVRQKNRRES